MRVLGVLCVPVFFAALSWSAIAHAGAEGCAVASLHGGAASVFRGNAVLTAFEAMPLAEGDRIDTGPGMRVVVLCAGEMRIAVGPETSLTLGATADADPGWAVFLLSGIAKFVRPLFGGKRFEVRTPSAVASVRSTEWFVEVGAGATAVFVDEGRVAVLARAGGAVLGAGEGIDVTADGVAGPVKTWGAGRVLRMRERLGLTGE